MFLVLSEETTLISCLPSCSRHLESVICPLYINDRFKIQNQLIETFPFIVLSLIYKRPKLGWGCSCTSGGVMIRVVYSHLSKASCMEHFSTRIWRLKSTQVVFVQFELKCQERVSTRIQTLNFLCRDHWRYSKSTFKFIQPKIDYTSVTRCWNKKTSNVFQKLPKRSHGSFFL